MSLTQPETARLFAALVAAGWQWRDDALYAPHESIWLVRTHPWNGSLTDMLERMTARLKRIQNIRDLHDPDEYPGIESDTALLVDALTKLVHGTE